MKDTFCRFMRNQTHFREPPREPDRTQPLSLPFLQHSPSTSAPPHTDTLSLYETTAFQNPIITIVRFSIFQGSSPRPTRAFSPSQKSSTFLRLSFGNLSI